LKSRSTTKVEDAEPSRSGLSGCIWAQELAGKSIHDLSPDENLCRSEPLGVAADWKLCSQRIMRSAARSLSAYLSMQLTPDRRRALDMRRMIMERQSARRCELLSVAPSGRRLGYALQEIKETFNSLRLSFRQAIITSAHAISKFLKRAASIDQESAALLITSKAKRVTMRSKARRA